MLNRMSSNPANCGQTSGDASGSRENTSICAGAATVGIASARFDKMPSHSTRLNQRPAVDVSRVVMVASESLQVLDNRALVGIGQRGAVDVTLAAVPGNGRVVAEERQTAG